MYQSLHTKIIDLTPYLPEPYSPPNKIRRQRRLPSAHKLTVPPGKAAARQGGMYT